MNHTCPRCNGGGRTPPPDYPRGLPPVDCPLCLCHGRIDEATLERVRGGESIRAARLAEGMSLRKFAGVCGIAPWQLSLIEQGLTIQPESVQRAVAGLAKAPAQHRQDAPARDGRGMLAEGSAGGFRRV